MYKQIFELKIPTLSFQDETAGRTMPVMIPATSTVTLVRGDMAADELIYVEWNGRMLKMFAVDLRERGTLIGGSRIH